MLNRGYAGTYHHMSAKHLHRCLRDFAARHNQRELDTKEQMAGLVFGGDGRRLPYADLAGVDDVAA